jgi:hypothetical protein
MRTEKHLQPSQFAPFRICEASSYTAGRGAASALRVRLLHFEWERAFAVFHQLFFQMLDAVRHLLQHVEGE